MKLFSATRRPRLRRIRLALTAAVAVGVVLAGCSTAPSDSGEEQPLTFWTLESEPNRVARTEASLKNFTEQTGIEVELVTIEESNLAQTMLTNAASGTLPDVMVHPMTMTARWVSQGLLDPQAAQDVIEALGPETFQQAALDLATVDGEYATVPTSGWGMLLHYRTDWFEAAGLDAPSSLEDIRNAAQVLNDPSAGRYGIVLGNDPAHQVTQQIFEQFALSNGCNMIDADGTLQLDSDRCVEVFEYYADLLNNYSPQGTLGSVEQRAVYQAGQAAMMLQGPFTLHRIANLEDAEPAVCPECADDPAYLAHHTGIVSVLEGFHGEKAQYALSSNLGISVDADTERAKQLVEYLLSDGYIEWLSMVPNGMIPTRLGTPEDPELFVNAWPDLNMGVDREGSLAEYYGPDVAQQLIDGAASFDAWGIKQGYGELAGVLYELYSIPSALSQVVDGSLTPEQAAQQVQAELAEELALLE